MIDSGGRTALVTGPGGLVGSAIVEALLRDGWHVICASRKRPARELPGTSWVPYDLGWRSLPPDFGSGAEVLIHAALATGARREPGRENVSGTELLFAAAARSGIERRIFISSLAAGTAARSTYAMQKRELERHLNLRVDAAVRPGLVIGAGGLFAALCTHLKRRRPIPLVDGGRQPLQTVLDEDVARAVARVAADRIAGTVTVASPAGVAYRTFVEAIARELNVPVRFLNVPLWLAKAAASAGELLRLPLPIGRDQVLNLESMRVQAVSGPPAIPQPLLGYDESIRRTLREFTPGR